MKERIYERNGFEFIVEECATKKEFNELAQEVVFVAVNELDDDGDFSLYAEYEDGSHVYIASWWELPSKKFTTRGMVFGVVSNPCTQQVYGKYALDEYGNVQSA